MREKHPIEVAINLFWNASIHFFFLSRMEDAILLPRIVAFAHIICRLLLVLIRAKAVTIQMVEVQRRLKDL